MLDEYQRRYDTVLKELFEHDHPSLLDDITGGVPVREYLNVDFPIILERRADLVLLLDDDTIKHIEFQSDNDPDMVFRQGIYGLMMGRLHKGKKISQIVLYFGPDEMKMSDYVDLGEIKAGYRLMDIRELDADGLMRTGRAGDLALAMLAEGGKEKLHQILEKTKSMSVENRNRALILMGFLSGLRRISDELRLEMKAMGSTYIDVKENAVLRWWLEEAQAEGKAIGEAIGKAEGKAEGEVEATARLLAKQLAAKFGPLPMWAEARLHHSTLDQLEALVVKVLNAHSLQEVLGPE